MELQELRRLLKTHNHLLIDYTEKFIDTDYEISLGDNKYISRATQKYLELDDKIHNILTILFHIMPLSSFCLFCLICFILFFLMYLYFVVIIKIVYLLLTERYLFFKFITRASCGSLVACLYNSSN